uniref:DUF4485 domain-containing protein n=1 Tax=Esox lucius TaxID=8010 RepID=A0A3P8XJ00_ESOLU
MNNDEETMEKLDSEFDHHLVDMKPYVLKLPQKIERQRCALWIKKLCDPGVSGMGPMGRKNRNMYSRLLLHMLRRGVLEGPFCHKPESGRLKTLPTYMSIYFDEPLCGRGLDQSTAGLPDWVNGELSRSDDSLSSLHRERMSSSPTSPSHPLSSSPGQSSSKHDNKEKKLSKWLFSHFVLLQIENPRYLRENPIPLSPIFLKSSLQNSTLTDEIPVARQEKEAEMKTKVLEAKHQEEKLKMQQKHDADVQKILDRKNGEIEELKTMYRVKQKQSEETVRKLEKKVQSVVRESQVIRESKEKQIAELKKMADQSTDTLKNEWEKKLHTVVAGMEQEKFDLQKKHTENIQELLEETNHRLAKMESEYGAQTRTTEQTVRELELRVKQLSVEVEKGNVLRQKVTQDKGQLEIHIATISSELQEANRSKQHEDTLQKLQGKHETDISHFQQEHALSAAKASDMIEDLEQTVAQLRQQLHDSEHRRQKQLRDTENKFQQDKADLQCDIEKKVHTLLTHNAERDALVQQHQQEVGTMEREARAALHQHQLQSQEWRQRDAQTVSDLEEQVSCLRDELQQAHSQRKQQLLELGVLREEERQRAAQDQEASLGRLRAEMDRIRLELERSHATDRQLAQEKVGRG